MKLLLAVTLVIGMFSVIGCKKTTTNNTVVQDSIYYSAWTPLLTTQEVDPTSGDTFYVQNITAPAITANIIAHGAILAYYGYPSSTSDTTVLSEAYMVAAAYTGLAFSPGQISITSGEDLTYTSSSGYLFRYVVIPANILAGTAMNGMTQQQLNKMSFTDLQKAINTAKQTSGNSFNP